jgi:hypothetical protein
VLASAHWDGYTVFSVISGVLLVLMSFTPRLKPGSRVLYVVGGIALAGYGIWVAKQTSGTYYFSVYIFIVPVIAVISFVKTIGTAKTPTRPTPTTTRPVTQPLPIGAHESAVPFAGPATSHPTTQSTASGHPGLVVPAPPQAPATPSPLAGQKIVIQLSDLERE